ncbi:Karyopherin (importin) alpha domain-containing protein [Dioscorea alata]|uniref:Karyopherin (Importin) alpha domain-containing protein n=1 Tax=Dioscorea alata TaxID=55571 RepID=A0ACB7U081_DIOAL|nr:Karyopherin (importin) alpha domain-containing protein [Dioscorea alata]
MAETNAGAGAESAAELLSQAQKLIPIALERAKLAGGFPSRWKLIISKLDLIPSRLSDLSGHPLFSKNQLSREQLHSVTTTLSDAISIADLCHPSPSPAPPTVGKLQMQSDLDSLICKLDLNLRDCALLVKTGVLSDATPPPSPAKRSTESEPSRRNVRELLARLQIGHSEAKHRAVDGLLAAIQDDEKTVLPALSRSSVSALVQLLSSTSPKIKEKASTILCLIVESGTYDALLVGEGILPPFIRLAESGTPASREKAVISLQRLSVTPDTARSIMGHGGVRPLLDICLTGDSITQSAAAWRLEKPLRLMINLLDSGIVLGSKEYAAECLMNLTATNDNLRRSVVAGGALPSLLAYLDGPLPQESGVSALRNIITSVPPETLISLSVLPRLLHAMKDGSPGAQQAAAAAINKVSLISPEMKKLVCDNGCIAYLVRMLEAKSNGVREAAAQALAGLVSCKYCGRVLKKDEKGVPNLVQLLDPSPANNAKKNAVLCLLSVSSSRKSKKMMVAHGAIGYLKKLSEMDVNGAKKLLERLERGKLKSLFYRR